MKITKRGLNSDSWNRNNIEKIAEIEMSEAVLQAQAILGVSIENSKYPMKILIDHIVTQRFMEIFLRNRMKNDEDLKAMFETLYPILWSATETIDDVNSLIPTLEPYVIDYCLKHNIELGYFEDHRE